MRPGLASSYTALSQNESTEQRSEMLYSYFVTLTTLLSKICSIANAKRFRVALIPFSKQYMVNPVVVNLLGNPFRTSKQAVLPCGSIYAGDVLWLSDDRVGRLVRFWSECTTATLVAQISIYMPFHVYDHCWECSNPSTIVTSVDSIVDAVTWFAYSSSTLIRVIKPVFATL
jgi:hypothetical protein